jgi:hypothetical protein
MEVLPIDIVSVIGVIGGLSIVLIPIIGLTARFALKPTVEALSRVFEGKSRDDSVQLLEKRIALIEQQMDVMETTMHRLAEVSEFHAELDAGDSTLSGGES